MKATQNQSNVIPHIAFLGMVSTAIIIARLFYLQVYQGSQFDTQSKKNYVRYEPVSSARGNILDCHGATLVTNKPIINLYWHGTGNARLNEEQTALMQHLPMVSSITCDQETIQAVRQAERKNEQLLLAHDIGFEQLSKIEERCGYHTNILIHHDFKRYYPHAQLACHAVGYLSNIPFRVTGKMGLEKQLHETLQGTDGIRVNTINSYGKKIETHELKKVQRGQDVHTTLDLSIQDCVERVFNSEYTGACIVMDPADGAVKALCSRPGFDPSIFLDPLAPRVWQSLQEQQPFLNRALQCTYPPGSLFKLITISAALQQGIITPDDTFTCKGYTSFGGRTYLCNRRRGHGTMNIEQAVALSCNTLFYELAQKLSIDTLAEYAHKFGLGDVTGIRFQEKSGLIPTSAWKQNRYGERWWPGETLSAAIGQSYILVNPMQIARMTGSIFTGYLVKPRLLPDEAIKTQPLDLEPATLNFLQRSMRSVVTHGTGHRVSRIEDMIIHAKTSTAQMSTMKKRSLGKQFLEHAWVAVHFQLKDRDPLVLVILVEHAGSSRVPMIIAKNILLSYRGMLS